MPTPSPFTADDLGFLQLADTAVLAAAARGELDLNRLARETLAARGMDDGGKWIGFEEARARLLPADTDPNPKREAILRGAQSLGFAEVEPHDRAEFHEVPVWTVRRALEGAYDAGVAATLRALAEPTA